MRETVMPGSGAWCRKTTAQEGRNYETIFAFYIDAVAKICLNK